MASFTIIGPALDAASIRTLVTFCLLLDDGLDVDADADGDALLPFAFFLLNDGDGFDVADSGTTTGMAVVVDVVIEDVLWAVVSRPPPLVDEVCIEVKLLAAGLSITLDDVLMGLSADLSGSDLIDKDGLAEPS
jgi:hypothetical protein